MRKSISIAVIFVLTVTFPAASFAAKTHKVKKSDTLYSLAKRYHVTVDDIKAVNNKVNSRLQNGDILVIPNRPVRNAGNDESGKAGHKQASYRIKKGDSLFKIARKTGISVTELKRLNGFNREKLKPGRVLVLQEAIPEKPVKVVAHRYVSQKNGSYLIEGIPDQTLEELTSFDPDVKVDLNEKMEATLEVSKQLKKTAFSFLGTRYRFGGTSRNGIDCSGFVQHVFRELDVTLPRTAREQYWMGESVKPFDLQKGDLLFFRTYASYPSHVGIYLGENKMIHASSRDRKVVISPITGYFKSRFIGAKRLAQIDPQLIRLEELFAGTGILEEKEEDVLRNDTLGLHLHN